LKLNLNILKSAVKEFLTPNARRKLRKLQRRLAYVKECIRGGGRLRESILLKLLEQHNNSRFCRQWVLSEEPPHFFDQRIGFFRFGFGDGKYGPYPFYRGFFSSQILHDGDHLLDIGCGDGFFTKRFFAEKCTHIDALDIERTAIKAATHYNRAPNITYHRLDAVNEPFPSDTYDVIVWDGALGHFSPETTDHMLQKIYQSLAPYGVFVGSESLGVEGSDHLQFFHSLEDLYVIFKAYFRYIELRQEAYKGYGEFVRKEAYWRCSNDPRRLREAQWQVFSSMDDGSASD